MDIEVCYAFIRTGNKKILSGFFFRDEGPIIVIALAFSRGISNWQT